MKYSRASIECGSPSKSPEVVIFPPKYPTSDQLYNQTERKHAYITVRQNSQMDVPINSERTLSSSPYARYDPARRDMVGGASTPDLSARSSSNIHGFNIHRHEDSLYSQPNFQRDLPQHKLRQNDVICENSTNTIDRHYVSRCSLLILVAMFVVAMTMSVYCLIMFLDLQSKYSIVQEQLRTTHVSLAQTQEDSQTCLPCAGLQLGPLPEENKELEQLIQKQENGIRICCAKTSAQMFVMMNLFVKRKHQEVCSNEKLKEEKSATGCNGSMPSSVLPPSRNGNISALLVLTSKQATPSDEDSQLQPIRNWNHTISGAHITNLYMTEDKTRLVVPESGRYYLYSQVSFFIYYDIDSNNAQDITQLLYQSVLRYNSIYPLDGSEELLRGVTTQCWERQKSYGKYTTYAGASVMLNKGDQIYVKASSVKHVFFHDRMTYFGLFKIG